MKKFQIVATQSVLFSPIWFIMSHDVVCLASLFVYRMQGAPSSFGHAESERSIKWTACAFEFGSAGVVSRTSILEISWLLRIDAAIVILWLNRMLD